MTFAELKHAMTRIAAPIGYGRGYDSHWNQYAVEALRDLQLWVKCLQRNMVDIVPHCSTMYKCGTTAIRKPDGEILAVGTVASVDPVVRPSTPFETGALLRQWAYNFTDMFRLNRLDPQMIFRARLEFQIGIRLEFKHHVAQPAVPPTWPRIRYKGNIWFVSADVSENTHWHPKLLRNLAKRSFELDVAGKTSETIEFILATNQNTVVWLEINEMSGPIMHPQVMYGVDVFVYGPPYSGQPELLSTQTEWCGFVSYQYVPPSTFTRWYEMVSRGITAHGVCLADFFPIDVTIAGKKALETISHSDLAIDIAASGDGLPLGFLRPERIPDSNYGRSLSGVWTVKDGLILLAPWIQRYENVVVQWSGSKLYWHDWDWIPDDPTLVRACAMWAGYRWNLLQRRDAVAASVSLAEYTELRAKLMYECIERNRIGESFDISDTVSSVYTLSRPGDDTLRELRITRVQHRHGGATTEDDDEQPRIIPVDVGVDDGSVLTGPPPPPPPPPQLPPELGVPGGPSQPGSPPPPRRGSIIQGGSMGSTTSGGTTTPAGGATTGGTTPSTAPPSPGGGGAGTTGPGGSSGGGGITGDTTAGDGTTGTDPGNPWYNSRAVTIELCCEDIGCRQKEGQWPCVKVELPEGYVRGRTQEEADTLAQSYARAHAMSALANMCHCYYTNEAQTCKLCCPQIEPAHADYHSPAHNTCEQGQTAAGVIQAETQEQANNLAYTRACEDARQKLTRKQCVYCNAALCVHVYCRDNPGLSYRHVVEAGKYCVAAKPDDTGVITDAAALAAKDEAHRLASEELRSKTAEFEEALRQQCSGEIVTLVQTGNVCTD